MIHIYYESKFVDAWANTMNDQTWIERTIIAMGWDPALVEVLEYESNLNGEIENAVILTDPPTMEDFKDNYFKQSFFNLLNGVLEKQKKEMTKNFIVEESEPFAPIATSYPSLKVHDIMKDFPAPVDSAYIMKEGSRLKIYPGETKLPGKYKSIKDVARWLLARDIPWAKYDKEFLAHLQSLTK
jgi:hypothetical protein